MWLDYVGMTDVDVTSGRYPCVRDHDKDGNPIADNDGRVLDPNSVLPFSVASYLAQNGAVQPDLTAGSRLGTISDSGLPPVVPDTAQYPADVSFAVTSTSSVPRQVSLADLVSIYTCATTGVTPLLPASGATRTAWEQLLGIADPDVAAGKYPCITTSVNGSAVAENDGRALTSSAIMPFAVSAYTDQLLGAKIDTRGSARLGVIDQSGGRQPRLPLRYNNVGGQPLTYHVYNAMPYAALDSSPVNETFVGPNSLVCQQRLLIAAFGFTPLAADDPEPCGSPQHDTSAPLTASSPQFHATLTPAVALDTGQLPGSGTQLHGKTGGCAVQGNYHNDQYSNTETVTARVSGAHCSTTVTATYYSMATHQVLPTETTTQDVASGGTVLLTHNGTAYTQWNHNGIAQVRGDVLLSSRLAVTDDAIGGQPGALVDLNASPVPGPDLLANYQDGINVHLAWHQASGETGYVVQRAEPVYGPDNFYDLAVVTSWPVGDVPQYDDDQAIVQVRYQYRVIPLHADGSRGAPSLPVLVVPAWPYRVKHYVALGDSYAAGMGASPIASGNGNCRRSVNNYAGLLSDAMDSNVPLSYGASQGWSQLDVLACSGARTYNVTPGLPGSAPQSGMEAWDPHVWGPKAGQDLIQPDYQITMLDEAQRRSPIDLVTLSIGGNDAGFSDVITDCALGVNGCTSGGDLTDYENRLRARIDSLSGNLAAVYRQVANHSGNAWVMVIGYPHIFPDNGSNNCAVDVRLLFTFLTTEKMAMLNRMTDELDAVIANTTAAVNTERHNALQMSFVDPRLSFAGHDACSSTPYVHKIQWAWPVTDPASAHPNNAGWQALATLIHNTGFQGTD
jgi:hypothetical protein